MHVWVNVFLLHVPYVLSEWVKLIDFLSELLKEARGCVWSGSQQETDGSTGVSNGSYGGTCLFKNVRQGCFSVIQMKGLQD